jgi:hypothetical protein
MKRAKEVTGWREEFRKKDFLTGNVFQVLLEFDLVSKYLAINLSVGIKEVCILLAYLMLSNISFCFASSNNFCFSTSFFCSAKM